MNMDIRNGIAVIHTDEVIITDTQSALDLMATVRFEHDTTGIVLPKSAIVEDFFVLSTGIAGEILQKFSNYRMRLAIVGDFSRYTSKPLRDFIYECNSVGHICFVATEAEAMAKMTG